VVIRLLAMMNAKARRRLGVMPGHSRSQNGVASLAHDPSIDAAIQQS
jgi:hypothetical protein